MHFKGIIFDLDGTLIDSLDDIANSMNTVLQQHGFPTHEIQAYKYFIGNGLRNLVQKTLPANQQDEDMVTICFTKLVELYRTNCINKTKPYEGIADLLDALVSQNLKISVFSNKADELTKKIVETLLPDWDFEVVIGLSVEAHKKPNPYVALQISQKTGIPPGEIIYVGDSGTDMQTANNAGMFAVGALWGFRSKEELTSNGAKHLLNHPMDLIQLL
jgi:phosphoglycolate phosphatase